MAKKKEKRGGKRKGAGRKPGIKKKNIWVFVPERYADEIKAHTVKLSKAYEERCVQEDNADIDSLL